MIEDKTHKQYDPSWNNKFSQSQNIDYYLYLIKSLMPEWQKYKNNMPQIPIYKYFKSSEIVGLKPELVEMLDRARGYAGVPFKITSGFRTIPQNESVGGVPDSSHTSGLAVDLAVKDSVTGGKILKGLAQALLYSELPFRFGFYDDGHIHVDIDPSKPSPCYWIK